MLFYRAALPLSSRTLTFVAGIIRRHRIWIGSLWRKLNPGQQGAPKLRSPGERANAQLKTWRILRKLRCCPGAPGSSARPSTFCRPARQMQDENGSACSV